MVLFIVVVTVVPNDDVVGAGILLPRGRRILHVILRELGELGSIFDIPQWGFGDVPVSRALARQVQDASLLVAVVDDWETVVSLLRHVEPPWCQERPVVWRSKLHLTEGGGMDELGERHAAPEEPPPILLLVVDIDVALPPVQVRPPG